MLVEFLNICGASKPSYSYIMWYMITGNSLTLEWPNEPTCFSFLANDIMEIGSLISRVLWVWVIFGQGKDQGLVWQTRKRTSKRKKQEQQQQQQNQEQLQQEMQRGLQLNQDKGETGITSIVTNDGGNRLAMSSENDLRKRTVWASNYQYCCAKQIKRYINTKLLRYQLLFRSVNNTLFYVLDRVASEYLF